LIKLLLKYVTSISIF